MIPAGFIGLNSLASSSFSGFGGGVFVILSGALLFAASVLHLTACLIHRDGIRKASKVFLVPLAACLHISLCGFRYPLFLIGLFFGWLGDIFLIPKDRKGTFIAGAVFFMAGHAFYVSNAFSEGLPQRTFSALGGFSVVITVLAVILVGTLAFIALSRRLNKKLLAVFVVYMAALLTMAGTLVYSALTMNTASAVLLCAGAPLFALSDFLLGAGIARAFRVKSSRFWVMITYILAQTCISLGLALM